MRILHIFAYIYSCCATPARYLAYLSRLRQTFRNSFEKIHFSLDVGKHRQLTPKAIQKHYWNKWCGTRTHPIWRYLCSEISHSDSDLEQTMKSPGATGALPDPAAAPSFWDCFLSVWDNFGIVSGSFWDRFWIVFGSFWDRFGIVFGVMLVSFWDRVWLILGSFGLISGGR